LKGTRGRGFAESRRMNDMRIAIVGPGAMGCLFAGLLAEGGMDVFLIDHRPERARKIDEIGVTIESGEKKRTAPVRAFSDPGAAREADGVVFMVKAYSTAGASERIASHVGGTAWVMSVQNGLGNTEILTNVFGEERVLAGTTSHGATLIEPGAVRHAGAGETTIGELGESNSERVNEIAAAFSAAGIETGVSTNVKGALWRKLLINVGINPITALLRIRNGELMRRESARTLMRMAVYEAESVSRVAKVKLEIPSVFELVETVALKTGDNWSSMCQDVTAGRMTEIDFICGAIVREGERNNIPTPVNRTMRDLIRAMYESDPNSN